MKKLTFLLFVVMGSWVGNLWSQTPESFNYQAVIRDSAGELLVSKSITVRSTIIDNTSDGLDIYKESHVVTTSKNGLINLQIGSKIPELGVFSEIIWGLNPKFLKIEVDAGSGTGFVNLGTVQLLSVPYALHADVATNLGTNKVYSTSSDTLFVVKDHAGNVVFAVFPDGAQVYVTSSVKGKLGGFAVSGRGATKSDLNYLMVTPDSTRIFMDNTVKGKLGGFAVSGRGSGKSTIDDYLIINRDSARIYINDTVSTKGSLGGFAVSGRGATKGSATDILQVTADSTRIYINDSGTKGKLGGFAVSGRGSGKSTVNDFFNISGSSIADVIDNESRVMWYPEKSALLAGEISVAHPDSVGQYSLSLGYRNIAKGKWSQAMGFQSVARGDYSTAIGYETVADTNSFAFGTGSKALGKNSFAFGAKGVDASGNMLPTATVATGDFSFAFGLGSTSSGLGSFVFGANCIASGDFSTAAGFGTTASGLNSTAFGVNNTSSGDVSFSMGSGNSAGGLYSIALGANNQANGTASVALGFGNIAGHYAIAGGYNNTSNGASSFAVGSNNITSGDGSIAAGTLNHCTQTTSAAFGSGNTSSGARSFAIGDNTTASGTNAFSSGFQSNATGDHSFTLGNQTSASATGAIATGGITKATGIYSISAGENTTAQAYASLVIGRFNTVSGNSASWSPADPLFVIGNGVEPTVLTNDAFVVYKNGNAKLDGHFYPNDNNLDSLGLAAHRWRVVVSTNGVISTSDKRLKSNITNLDYGLKEILKLRPVSFIWKDTTDPGVKLGLIAQEVQPIIKEVVDVGNDGNKTLGLRYSDLIPVLIKSIQEQQAIIEQEKKRNDGLENQLNEINKKLKELELLIKK